MWSNLRYLARSAVVLNEWTQYPDLPQISAAREDACAYRVACVRSYLRHGVVCSQPPGAWASSSQSHAKRSAAARFCECGMTPTVQAAIGCVWGICLFFLGAVFVPTVFNLRPILRGPTAYPVTQRSLWQDSVNCDYMEDNQMENTEAGMEMQ